MTNKTPANGAWSSPGPGVDFFNFTNICKVTKLTDDKLAPNSEKGLGNVIPLKTAAIEGAQQRATISFGIYTLIANI